MSILTQQRRKRLASPQSLASPQGLVGPQGLTRRRGRRWALALTTLAITATAIWWSRSRPIEAEVALVVLPQSSASSALVLSADQKPVEAIELFSQMLAEAKLQLSGAENCEMLFRKQERIDGTLQPQQTIDLKIRRSPMSVYMRWQQPEEGQEVLWQENANEGQLLVHPGGWRGKLLPMIKLDPHGERAMEGNRRPISSIGPWNLIERLGDYAAQCQGQPGSVEVSVIDSMTIGERSCYCFQFQHLQPAAGLEFGQVMVFIDKLSKLPIAVQNYGWPTAAAECGQLEESYVFEALRLNVALSDNDFNHENPRYAFIPR